MSGLINLLFPRAAGCLVCGDPRRAEEKYGLCPECRQALVSLRLRENVCPRCMHPLNEKGRCPFCAAGQLQGLSAGYGAYRYGGAARQLIRALKFGYQDEAAAALAAGMAQCFPAHQYDALVPVPLYRTRRRERGANQARILCDGISARTGLPVLEALRRIRSTKAQTKLSGRERQRNVAGAFALTREVKGLRLLVVDDVRTTGATARACAAELTAGGAACVAVLTAAIAVLDKR